MFRHNRFSNAILELQFVVVAAVAPDADVLVTLTL
jgi:hypothetical protein